MVKVAEMGRTEDPGVLETKSIDINDVLCNVRTWPAATTNNTLDAPFVDNSSGKKENPAKQDPGTATPSRYRARAQTGTGAGNQGVNCPAGP